jgi:hypothetical protein
MSLFGDDDLPARPKQSASLFDDDPKPASKSGSGLFADDLQSDDSPWGFPTPKKAARGSLIKSLLPAADVPDSYIDAYDVLLEADEGAPNSLSLGSVKKLLSDSGLSSDVQAKIVEMVSQPGQERAEMGRNEFNVLYALIGLAQEGDDITLDSVDERKRSTSAVSATDHRLSLTCALQTSPFRPYRSLSRQRKSSQRVNPSNQHRTNLPQPHPSSSSPQASRPQRRTGRVPRCGNSLLATRRPTRGLAQICIEGIVTPATRQCQGKSTGLMRLLPQEQPANSPQTPRQGARMLEARAELNLPAYQARRAGEDSTGLQLLLSLVLRWRITASVLLQVGKAVPLILQGLAGL